MAEFFDVIAQNYKYNKVQDIDIPTDDPDWTPVNQLQWTGHPAGIFEFAVSIKWNLDTQSRSGGLRYTIDGGGTWWTAWEEPKDRTDDRHAYYAFPVPLSAGDIDFRVEMTKESGTNAMNVRFCDLIIKRVG